MPPSDSKDTNPKREVDSDAYCQHFVSHFVRNLASRNYSSNVLSPLIETSFGVVLMVDVSGYSKLTSFLSERGTIGCETLHTIVKSYLDKIVAVVLSHGGDVVKFAGDAIVVIWRPNVEQPVTDTDKGMLVFKAATCSLDLLTNLGTFQISELLEAVLQNSTDKPSAQEQLKPPVESRKPTLVSKAFRLLGDSSGEVDAPRRRRTSVLSNLKQSLRHSLHASIAGTLSRSGQGSALENSLSGSAAPKESEPPASHEERHNELRIHLGIGAGKVFDVVVGSAQHSRFEHFVAGEAVEQLGLVLDLAKPGELALSHTALGFLRHYVDLNSVSLGGYGKRCIILNGLERAVKLEPTVAPVVPQTSERVANLSLLKYFINDAALRKLENDVYSQGLFGEGNDVDTITHSLELRQVSTMFIKIGSLATKDVHQLLSQSQSAITVVNNAMKRYGGSLRQFHVDDKGALLLCFFGLPPFSHNDDAGHCARAALSIKDRFSKLFSEFSIGLTTGTISLGAVGNASRLEYALMGDSINMAARLMCLPDAKNSAVSDLKTCKLNTELLNSSAYFRPLGVRSVKGKAFPIPVFELSPVDPQAKAGTLHGHSSSMIMGRELQKRYFMESISWAKGTLSQGHEEALSAGGSSQANLLQRSYSSLTPSIELLYQQLDDSDSAENELDPTGAVRPDSTIKTSATQTPQLVLVEGDLGQGLSKLMQYSLQECDRAGLVVLSHCANEEDANLQFATMKALFLQLLRSNTLSDSEKRLKGAADESSAVFGVEGGKRHCQKDNGSGDQVTGIELAASTLNRSSDRLNLSGSGGKANVSKHRKLQFSNCRILSDLEGSVLQKVGSVPTACAKFAEQKTQVEPECECTQYESQQLVRSASLQSDSSVKVIGEDLLDSVVREVDQTFRAAKLNVSQAPSLIALMFPKMQAAQLIERFASLGYPAASFELGAQTVGQLAELYIQILEFATMGERAICLHLQEAQWIDSLSLYTLTLLAKRLPERVIMHISSIPTERYEDVNKRAYFDLLKSLPNAKYSLASGLSLTETGKVVCGYATDNGIPVDEVDTRLLEVIYATTNGRPNHILLVVQRLLEAGYLRAVSSPKLSTGFESLSRAEELLVSSTVLESSVVVTAEMCVTDINASVSAEFDKLDRKFQLLLQIGTIIGVTFSFGDALYILAQASGLQSIGEGMVRQEALYELFTGLDRYQYLKRVYQQNSLGCIKLTFSNVMIREYIFQAMSSSQKSRIHELLGRMYADKLRPSTKAKLLPLVQHHYCAAVHYRGSSSVSEQLTHAAQRYTEALAQEKFQRGDLSFAETLSKNFLERIALPSRCKYVVSSANDLLLQCEIKLVNSFSNASDLGTSAERKTCSKSASAKLIKKQISLESSLLRSAMLTPIPSDATTKSESCGTTGFEIASALFATTYAALLNSIISGNWRGALRQSLGCVNMLYCGSAYSLKTLSLTYAAATYSSFLFADEVPDARASRLQHVRESWTKLSEQAALASFAKLSGKFDRVQRVSDELTALHLICLFYASRGKSRAAVNLVEQALETLKCQELTSKQEMEFAASREARRLERRDLSGVENELIPLRRGHSAHTVKTARANCDPVINVMDNKHACIIVDHAMATLIIDGGFLHLLTSSKGTSYSNFRHFPGPSTLSCDVGVWEAWLRGSVKQLSTHQWLLAAWRQVLSLLDELQQSKFGDFVKADPKVRQEALRLLCSISVFEKTIHLSACNDPFLYCLLRIAKLDCLQRAQIHHKQRWNAQILELASLLLQKGTGTAEQESRGTGPTLVQGSFARGKGLSASSKPKASSGASLHSFAKSERLENLERYGGSRFQRWIAVGLLLQLLQRLLNDGSFLESSHIPETLTALSAVYRHTIVPTARVDRRAFYMVTPMVHWTRSLLFQLKHQSLVRQGNLKHGTTFTNLGKKEKTADSTDSIYHGVKSLVSRHYTAPIMKQVVPTFQETTKTAFLDRIVYGEKKAMLLKALKSTTRALDSVVGLEERDRDTFICRSLTENEQRIRLYLAV